MNQSRVFGRFGFIDGKNQLFSLRVDAQRQLLIPCLLIVLFCFLEVNYNTSDLASGTILALIPRWSTYPSDGELSLVSML